MVKFLYKDMKYVLPKLCVDCKHYMWPGLSEIVLSKNSNRLGKCKKFYEYDNITGCSKGDFAHLARINENKCGKDAKYFEEK